MATVRCLCSITECGKHPNHGAKQSRGDECYYARPVIRIFMLGDTGHISSSIGSGTGPHGDCLDFKRCVGCELCQPLPDWAKDEDPESKSS